MKKQVIYSFCTILYAFLLLSWTSGSANNQKKHLTFPTDSSSGKKPVTGKPISPDLFGVFFEDLSYAADGGLYAELIQNRSFEYTSADLKGWNELTAWDLMVPDKAKAAIAVETAEPLNHRNPHYAVLT